MQQIRYFAVVAGALYLLIGVLGFLPPFVQPPAVGAPELAVGTAYGDLFGLFPVNALHSFAHVVLGFWGLMAYRQVRQARIFAQGLTIIYAVLAVMGLISVLKTFFGLIPLYGHDIWLHAVTAAVAAYFGWGVQREAAEQRASEEMRRTA